MKFILLFIGILDGATNNKPRSAPRIGRRIEPVVPRVLSLTDLYVLKGVIEIPSSIDDIFDSEVSLELTKQQSIISFNLSFVITDNDESLYFLCSCSHCVINADGSLPSATGTIGRIGEEEHPIDSISAILKDNLVVIVKSKDLIIELKSVKGF